MTTLDKDALDKLLTAKIEKSTGEDQARLIDDRNLVKKWHPETGEPCPINIEKWLSPDEIAQITIVAEQEVEVSMPEVEQDTASGEGESERVNEQTQALTREEKWEEQLEDVRRALDGDNPAGWLRAQARAQEIATDAEGELVRVAEALLHEAGRLITQEINRLKGEVRTAKDVSAKREKCQQILSLEPNNQWARERLIALDIVASVTEVEDGASRARGKLQDLLEKLSRGETVQALELYEAIQEVRQMQARLDPDADQDLYESLEKLIRPAEAERDRLRQEEGERVTDTARRKYQEVVEEYDRKLRQGENHIFDEAGQPFPIARRRGQVVEDWRQFVHEKIPEKVDLAERQTGYPKLALGNIQDALQLLDDLIRVSGGGTKLDREKLQTLEKKQDELEAELKLWQEADVKFRQAMRERDIERRLDLLREAKAYPDYPGLEAEIARAETTLANVLAAELWAEMEVIRGGLITARSQEEIAKLRRRSADLLTHVQKKGVQSKSLETALKDREELLQDIDRAAEFLREVGTAKDRLAETPPAIAQALALVENLRTRFPEHKAKLDQIEIDINAQGNDQQKFEAARKALELQDNPVSCLRTLDEIGTLTADMRDLQMRASIRQYEKVALEARRQGRYDDALESYETLKHLAPDRDAELEDLIQKANREKELVGAAESAAKRGDYQTACQKLEEALQLRGDRLGVDPRLDNYRLAWRDQILKKLHAWLDQEEAENWRQMLDLVETARHKKLLLSEQDQRLADQVETRCRRRWLIEAEPTSDHEQMRKVIEQFEDLLAEEPDLADDFELHYKLALFWLLSYEFDHVREYIRRCRHILKTKEVASKFVLAQTRKETTRLRGQGTPSRRMEILQRELEETVVLKAFMDEVRSRVDSHGQAGHAGVDVNLVKRLRAAKPRLTQLEITGELLWDDFRDLGNQVIDCVLEEGRKLDSDGPTVEGLQRYQWARWLLDTYASFAGGISKEATASYGGFRRTEVDELIRASATEFPRLLAKHQDSARTLKAQLQETRDGLPIEPAYQRTETLLEQAHSLQEVLEELQSLVDLRIQDKDRRALTNSVSDLGELMIGLDQVRSSLDTLAGQHADAVASGKLGDETFERAELTLKSVRDHCRELLSDGIKISEVIEMSRQFNDRLDDMVLLPIWEEVTVYRDTPIQFEQAAIPNPLSDDTAGNRKFDWHMAYIGERELHKILVAFGRNLQQAWIGEQFEMAQQLYEMMVRCDPNDRYGIQKHLRVLDGHEGRPVSIEGLTQLKARLTHKLENLETWQSSSTKLQEHHSRLVERWREVEEMKAESHRLEERLAEVNRFLTRLESSLKVIDSDLETLSSRAGKIKDQQVTPKLDDLKAIHKSATKLQQQLEAYLSERKTIFDKLLGDEPLAEDENYEQLCTRALEIDPSHETVQALCLSDPRPPRERPKSKGLGRLLDRFR